MQASVQEWGKDSMAKSRCCTFQYPVEVVVAAAAAAVVVVVLVIVVAAAAVVVVASAAAVDVVGVA